jgi:hypothetical protein
MTLGILAIIRRPEDLSGQVPILPDRTTLTPTTLGGNPELWIVGFGNFSLNVLMKN